MRWATVFARGCPHLAVQSTPKSACLIKFKSHACMAATKVHRTNMCLSTFNGWKLEENSEGVKVSNSQLQRDLHDSDQDWSSKQHKRMYKLDHIVEVMLKFWSAWSFARVMRPFSQVFVTFRRPSTAKPLEVATGPKFLFSSSRAFHKQRMHLTGNMSKHTKTLVAGSSWMSLAQAAHKSKTDPLRVCFLHWSTWKWLLLNKDLEISGFTEGEHGLKLSLKDWTSC